MKRSISLGGMLFVSVSAIIGSGWLFASYYTSKIAGPASLLSWIIGGAAIICLALVFAEISTMLPVAGSSVRIPQCTHGTIVGFFFAWVIWLSYAVYISAESQAVMQYLRFYFPILTNPAGQLTMQGYLASAAIILGFSILNIYSLRWLVDINNILTILKLVIPVTIAIGLLVLFFEDHRSLHMVSGRFMPYGLKGVFYAISMGGIIFAFNGFKQAAEMAGEARNPGKNLPIAIIGSVIICLAFYLLLQIAFLSSVKPWQVLDGWKNLHLNGEASPLATILSRNNSNISLILLYIAAVVAPLGAGLMYFSSACRSIYSMSCNGYLPKIFRKLNPYGNPVYAILANFSVGMILFAPLPGWDKLASFLTALLAVSYLIGPLSLLVLRKQLPKRHRPFRMKLPKILGLFVFYICNLMVYWSGWDIISKLGIAIIIGFIVFFLSRVLLKENRKRHFNWLPSVWLWVYFLGTIIISYLGSFGSGKGVIPFGWDFVIIAIFSIGVVWLSLIFVLPARMIKHHLDRQLSFEEAH